MSVFHLAAYSHYTEAVTSRKRIFQSCCQLLQFFTVHFYANLAAAWMSECHSYAPARPFNEPPSPGRKRHLLGKQIITAKFGNLNKDTERMARMNEYPLPRYRPGIRSDRKRECHEL